MKIKKILSNQSGETIIAELLVSLLVLGMVGMGGYRIHQNENPEPDAVTSCDSKSCFQEKFSECEKANFTNSEDGYHLEIYGADDNGCRMFLKYDESDPVFAGKHMTCSYDNSLPFEEAGTTIGARITAGKDVPCEGPLVELIKGYSSLQ